MWTIRSKEYRSSIRQTKTWMVTYRFEGENFTETFDNQTNAERFRARIEIDLERDLISFETKLIPRRAAPKPAEYPTIVYGYGGAGKPVRHEATVTYSGAREIAREMRKKYPHVEIYIKRHEA